MAPEPASPDRLTYTVTVTKHGLMPNSLVNRFDDGLDALTDIVKVAADIIHLYERDKTDAPAFSVELKVEQ